MSHPTERMEGSFLRPSSYPRKVRASLFLPLFEKMASVEMTVEGEHNLPVVGEAPSILAIDHARDNNMALAYPHAVMHGDTFITGQSTHERLDPRLRNVVGFGSYLLVSDRFLGVSTKYTPQGKVNAFEPHDTAVMVDTLNNGSNVMVATHSPESLRPGTPIRPGKIAGLLGLRSLAPIVPIAMQYELGTKRAEHVTMKVGDPYTLDEYDDIEDFLKTYEKKRLSGELSPTETSLVTEGLHRIEQAGTEVFERTNNLLNS